MDTKSRKFDRTWITKTIAFLLAIVLFAAAAVKTVLFVFDWDENGWDVESCLEVVLRSDKGAKSKNDEASGLRAFTGSRAFARIYRNYVDDVVRGALTLSDGSEQAYEAYKAAQQAEQEGRHDQYVQAVLQDCLGQSGHGSPAALGWYLFNGYVSLRKLANHQKHFVDGRIEVTNGWYQYYSDSGEEGYDMDFDFNRNGEDPLAPTMADGDFGTEDIQSSFEIPEDVQNWLRDGEYAVELCHTALSTSRHEGQEFDGYYALTLDETRIVTDRSAGEASRMLYVNHYKDYDTFRNAWDSYRQTLSGMKNLKIAVVDNSTGLAVSNLPKLDGKHFGQKAQAWFEGFDWYGSYDFASSQAVYSDAYQRDLDGGGIPWLMLNDIPVSAGANVTVWTALEDDLIGDDTDEVSQAYHNSLVVRSAMSALLKFDLICLGGIILCVLYLLIRAGRRHGDDALHYMAADRIFTLLRTAINGGLCVGLGFLFVLLAGVMYDENLRGWLMLGLLGLVAAAAMAFLIDWLLFVMRHIKGHTLFKNLFLVWLIRKLLAWRKEKKAAMGEKPPVEYADLHKDVRRRVLLLGFLPNLVMGVLAVIFMGCELWFLAIPLLLVIFGYNVWLAVYVLRYAYRVRAGIEAVHRIRGGDYDVHLAVDEKSPALACFARDVNSINDGLHVAVSNAIKDERMRAELITNVSHDLKTPLTSIINYVDLLSRCDIRDETAQQYLSVLTEKSARLKKLIEDLVEASKASSGAMRVDLVDMSLGELTNQIVGEYDDAFTERNLELIYTAERDVLVRADSKLSYRVLDNLMSNVKKYAMPGTRVYLDLTETETHGVLTLRNVSQTQLNIPVEELLERFVRADESRSTEGSGLGLSIAQNLCELQGAELHLSISGDLFTAEVRFPRA
ncbi:MAG: HAMP domain-containing histidine kinase [Clostridia bacterium]|nr:HAMP domain-containing histidine kinase [Clostridia bacterium]